MTDDERSSARYLYAVCRGLDPAVLQGVPGLGDAPLEVVVQQDLAAVVSTVSLAVFGEEALRRNLEDIAWLEETARVHDQVVRAVSRWAPTAPMRLATICFDDAVVRARLREWYVDLAHVLDRIEGCSEWSVKVLTAPTEPAIDDPAAPAVTNGADYLRRKKLLAERRSAHDSSVAEAAGRIHDALVLLARASRVLPAQDPRLSGHRGTMVLNAAYLVPDQERAAFAALVEQLCTHDDRVVVDSRGPWPPYSFAMLEAR
ncbi:GvpL/GvpF family gas vesicle protein [Pimelobacter simplex]|uniref:GvpL/GvpF family gas vesicle protein n=1 Tax=Nocardioides simplex TaxID=2045 RepID=UPI003802F7E4